MKKVNIPSSVWAPGIWIGTEGMVLDSNKMSYEEICSFFGKTIADECYSGKANWENKTFMISAVDLVNRVITFKDENEK